ncbi:MAG: epoxyqueuosine reductase QueH [Armatimonadota bacterium]|nr:MAG: epoxyqueuosine reductase QueH [Armatimonadota bacterium]
MKLLLHCCCGPCATVVADYFRRLGDEVVGWFFNPNVHPEEERVRREEVLAEGARRMELPLLPAGRGMGLDKFLLALARRGGSRCEACYELRLVETAKEAGARGFGGFSSTLLISPYQDVAAIADIGRRAAERFGLEFRSADLRESYRESCERAREMGLYRQNYCGCRFSELERAERRALRAISKLGARAASAPRRNGAGRQRHR